MNDIAYILLIVTLIILVVYFLFSIQKLRKQNKVINEQAQKISFMNTELQVKNQKLIQLNLEKNKVIGVVSHDLKAPFNRMHALISLLKMEEGQLGKMQRAHLAKIEMVISEGLTLIRNLLDIRAIEDKGIKMKFEKVSIPKVLVTILRSYEALVQKKRIKLKFTNRADVEAVEMDKLYLNRIIENVLSNAVKYTKLGGMVELILENDDQNVLISIKDEGPGISEEEQKDLFEKYKVLSAKPSGGETSTGLGLSIAKSLAKTLHGDINVESILGEGSTFIINLPMKRLSEIN